MNKENLRRMADYIETVPQEKFDMFDYRCDTGDWTSKTCGSVGCAIGHCTALDAQGNMPFHLGEIDFNTWSERFTGLLTESPEWVWCFFSDWTDTDNTPTGAAKRIRWLLENGLPEDWRSQMHGHGPLCYA